jgi:hypothetical protein
MEPYVKPEMYIQTGPCKLCGAVNYPLSFGGPDICPICDCYGCCRRCKILIEENKFLLKQIDELTAHPPKKEE